MAERQLGTAPSDLTDTATKGYVDAAKNAFSGTVGNGTLTVIPVTHNLGTMDVITSVHLIATGEEVECDVVKTNATTVTLTFAAAPAASSLRVTVIGTAFANGSPIPTDSTGITDSGTTGRALIRSGTAADAQAAIGLTGAVSTILAGRRVVQTVTAPTSLDSVASKDYVILIGSGGAPILPTAAGNTSRYTLKNIDTASRTVATTGGQTIDGVTPLTLLPGQSVGLISDGTNWRADDYLATATGKALLTAADAAAARAAIGAGTGASDLVLGTTNYTAKAGDYQPISTNISDSTSVGRQLITAVDAAAARTAIGVTLGSPTTVKTAAYSAQAGEIIRADATAGGFTIALPEAPAVGTMVWVKKIDSSANAVIVQRSNTDTFDVANTGTSLLQLMIPGQSVCVQYSSGVWLVTGNSLPPASLDDRYFRRGAAIPDINGNTAIQIVAASNAVNHLRVEPAATGGAVMLRPGSLVDDNVDLTLRPKGTGGILAVDSNGLIVAWFAPGSGTPVNKWKIQSSAAGTPVKATAYGGASGDDVGIDLVTKNNGVVRVGSTPVEVATISGIQTLTNKQMTTIELGHASDTTLSRSAAGVLAVEGRNVGTWGVTTLTGSSTLSGVPNHRYITLISAGGAPTLPTAVSNSSLYTLKNIDTSAKTVSATSPQTIEGSTTYTLPAGASIDVVSDNANWRII